MVSDFSNVSDFSDVSDVSDFFRIYPKKTVKRIFRISKFVYRIRILKSEKQNPNLSDSDIRIRIRLSNFVTRPSNYQRTLIIVIYTKHIFQLIKASY